MATVDADTVSTDGKMIRCNFKPGSVKRFIDDLEAIKREIIFL
jgi:hypothetical protein